MKLCDRKEGCKNIEEIFGNLSFERNTRKSIKLTYIEISKKFLHRHPFISSREVMSKQVNVIVVKIFPEFLSKNFYNNHYYTSRLFTY